MTVTYSNKVVRASFACFLKLLMRWRGSIYKLIWMDFLVFVVLYYVLKMIEMLALSDSQKKDFLQFCKYCEQNTTMIPIAFVLGFYVAIVVSRWHEQFNSIPWPDQAALYITACLHGHDERGRLMRRTCMRYLCLSFVIVLSCICSPVRKRFPSWQHMADAGIMLDSEKNIISKLKTSANKYFVPLIWCTSVISRARKEGRIKDDYAAKALIDEVNEFRRHLGQLLNFDWVNIPLVYTQVVTVAVYTFLGACLFGRQYDTDGNPIFLPFFTFMQFFFYMGWLKVAQSLLNPFGEDDDDFDVNQLIDRNLQLSYLIVDEMHQEHPELIRDAYWDNVDFDLPYTAAAEIFKSDGVFLGSAVNVNVDKDADFVHTGSVDIDLQRQSSVSSLKGKNKKNQSSTKRRLEARQRFSESSYASAIPDSIIDTCEVLRMDSKESCTSSAPMVTPNQDANSISASLDTTGVESPPGILKALKKQLRLPNFKSASHTRVNGGGEVKLENESPVVMSSGNVLLVDNPSENQSMVSFSNDSTTTVFNESNNANATARKDDKGPPHYYSRLRFSLENLSDTKVTKESQEKKSENLCEEKQGESRKIGKEAASIIVMKVKGPPAACDEDPLPSLKSAGTSNDAGDKQPGTSINDSQHSEQVVDGQPPQRPLQQDAIPEVVTVDVFTGRRSSLRRQSNADDEIASFQSADEETTSLLANQGKPSQI